MTHDTSEPTTVFTSSNSPANFVSPPCHLVLHCLDQVTDQSPTHTHALSLELYPSIFINHSLFDGKSHRH